MVKSKQYRAIFQAILAATLFGISSPFSKILLKEIPPTLMAALLYLGAGLGMLLVNMVITSKNTEQKEAKITKNDLPFVIAMIILDIAAPIFLMLGLSMTTAANASLLNNFEIVATSLIALFVFKEAIGKRLWLTILLITLSSIILSVDDFSNFTFSIGSVFVLLACICWGFENNCTRMLSLKNPIEIVVLKGFGSGSGSLIISLILREYASDIRYIIGALVLGFFAYGLSIFFYVNAQRELGAVRTSSYYSIAPFIGTLISVLIFNETIKISFIVAFVLIILGTYLSIKEKHIHRHIHPFAEHNHKHSHDDEHHNHTHLDYVNGQHLHDHIHEEGTHIHQHNPDMHHSHLHKK